MKIAVLPGDGIGTEIVAEAVKVLNTLDLKFEMETALVGGAAYDAHGHPLPESTLKLAKEADAILFGAVGDWKLDCVQLFKSGKIREARTLLCQSSTPEEADDIFRWMYDNLDLWATDPERQDQAIIIIRNGLVNVPMVADQEINLSATLVELSNL